MEHLIDEEYDPTSDPTDDVTVLQQQVHHGVKQHDVDDQLELRSDISKVQATAPSTLFKQVANQLAA